MKEFKPDIIVDITGLKCPIPLIKTRRAIKEAVIGNIIEFTGTKEEEISKKEILIALRNLNQTILNSDNINDNGNWYIFSKKEI